jgi:hypothetical protein
VHSDIHAHITFHIDGLPLLARNSSVRDSLADSEDVIDSSELLMVISMADGPDNGLGTMG